MTTDNTDRLIRLLGTHQQAQKKLLEELTELEASDRALSLARESIRIVEELVTEMLEPKEPTDE